MYQCLNPRVAVSLCKTSEGKHHLKFLSLYRDWNLKEVKAKYGADHVFVLPCGKCSSCRKNYAKEWGIRCTLEAKMHPYNYFLTLTFDENHIKYACKKDLKKFFDRLSGKGHKNKFMYFGCMEHGTLNGRLHFHLVLFCDFPLTLYDQTKIGDYYYYHSPEIDNCWSFGLYNIATFESSCARYVAKYTSKEGQIFMSRNIGKSYVMAHFDEIIKDKFILYGDFGNSRHSVNCPRSVLRWFLDAEIPQASIYKNNIKKLAILVSAYYLRSLVAQHEEVGMINNQAKLKDVSIERRF